jgi:hypothetical protein
MADKMSNSNDKIAPCFIKTTYWPKKDEKLKVQWWMACLCDCGTISLDELLRYGRGSMHYPMENHLGKIANSNVWDIQFIPVNYPQLPRDKHDYTGYSDHSVKDPIIIRGKSMPVVFAKVTMQNNIRYYSKYVNKELTTGQKDQFSKWFNDQLKSHITENLLKYLISQERKAICKRLLNEAQSLEEGLTKFRKYILDLDET